MNETPDLQEGDIFYTRYNDKFHLYKLLKKDGESGAYHVLSYVPQDELPDPSSVEELPVYVYHLPMHAESFVGAELLTHSSVTEDELIGYYTYLGHMEEDFEEKAGKAAEYFEEAYKLTDQGKTEEAIEKYSMAIELIPEFFEAIDNRAFCKMDLERWEDAIADFRLSLQVQPDSLLAEFSIGECYFRLGQFEKAREQFLQCTRLDPTHQVSADMLARTTEIIGSGS